MLAQAALLLFGVLMMKWFSVPLFILVLSACSDATLETKQEKLLAAVNDVLSYKIDNTMPLPLQIIPKLSPFVFKKAQQHEIHPSLQKLLREKWRLAGVVNSPKPKICYIRDTQDEVTYLYMGETFSSGLWKVVQLNTKGVVLEQQKSGEKKLLRFFSQQAPD